MCDSNFPSIPLPKSVEQGLTNIVDPPTKAVGQTFKDIWDIVIGNRVSHVRQKQELVFSQKLEDFKAELVQSVSQIPPEKQVNPEFQTISQALDDSKYCVENDVLRSMFVSLITSTLDADSAHDAHPSFSGIIKQMSTVDALLFQKIYKSFGNGYIPMVTPQLSIGDTGRYVPGAFPFWFSGIQIDGINPFQISSSLISLQRFGLVTLMHKISLSDPSQHDFLHNHPFLTSIRDARAPLYPDFKLHIRIDNSVAHITDFGLSFARCCL